jgi:hypothetical protein
MTDLTAITTPFGLLDEATREALKAHGGPIEIYTGKGWGERPDERWWDTLVYRVKPQPPKPREWWVTGDSTLWRTEYDAEEWVELNPQHGPIIHVREVTD